MVNLRKASTDESDSLRVYLAGQRAFDEKSIGLITNGRPFYRRFPSNTSWSTAKSTTIIAEFDYKIVEDLTDVYGAQEFFTKETLAYITRTFYSSLSDDERATIGSLLLQIDELVGQEELVITNIDKAREAMGGKKPGTGL